MKFLQINTISKSYGQAKIFDQINLELDAGHTLSILGKSGCGKTTMLKTISGLVSSDEGDIILEGNKINDLSPNLRNIVYLYQEDLLFPHLTVFENIAFGLRLQKLDNKVVHQKVNEMMINLELEGHHDKMPNQISGGQRQRVSFGRAIIINPKLLLLDEPFGSLDVETRYNMQQLFKRLAVTYNITSLFVTHDLKEAFLMGDAMAYMKDGTLKVYPNKNAFINDQTTGMQDEISFWNNIKNLDNE